MGKKINFVHSLTIVNFFKVRAHRLQSAREFSSEGEKSYGITFW